MANTPLTTFGVTNDFRTSVSIQNSYRDVLYNIYSVWHLEFQRHLLDDVQVRSLQLAICCTGVNIAYGFDFLNSSTLRAKDRNPKPRVCITYDLVLAVIPQDHSQLLDDVCHMYLRNSGIVLVVPATTTQIIPHRCFPILTQDLHVKPGFYLVYQTFYFPLNKFHMILHFIFHDL